MTIWVVLLFIVKPDSDKTDTEEYNANIEISDMNYVSESLYQDILIDEYNKKIQEINATNKLDWFIEYKQINQEYSCVCDNTSIYDEYTQEELDLLFRVVQAEIGDYSFEQKCNVVSVIFNRIEYNKQKPHEFSNSLGGILVPNQFSTISNGRIYSVVVDEDTVLACEYVYLFGDTANGALFFDSNGALESSYKKIFNDGAHNFYTTYY